MIDPKRLRCLAGSALNGFQTLDLETAIWLAKSELMTMIRLLDGADYSMLEPVVGSVNDGVRRDFEAGDLDSHDFTDSEIMNIGRV